MKQETILISKREDCLEDDFDFTCIVPSTRYIKPKEPVYDLDTIIKMSFELLKSLEPTQRAELFNIGLRLAIQYFVLPSIEEKVAITNNAKKILVEDLKLLVSIEKVINNLEPYRNINFTFKEIDFDYDPEDPEWEIITISIKIEESNYEKLFEIEDEIVDKAFKGIDIEMIKKISIVTII